MPRNMIAFELVILTVENLDSKRLETLCFNWTGVSYTSMWLSLSDWRLV